MGYTHYWYRVEELDPVLFKKVVEDFKTFLPLFKTLDVQLADGLGEGEPTFTDDVIRFNGKHDCGHPVNKEIVIPWPAEKTKNGVAPDSVKAQEGRWFAGVTLNQRTCGGSCDYETFALPRVFNPEFGQPDEKTGKLFDCCKTAYRPYDLAVQILLIIAKQHFGKDIKVSSDGNMSQWLDAATMCQNVLDYGLEVPIFEEC